MGSVRDREIPEPNEYRVSGVRWNGGRGPGDIKGGEKRPGFAVESERRCFWLGVLGVLGEAVGIIWIPSPGSMSSWNLDRWSLGSSFISSLDLSGMEAYSGLVICVVGVPKGDTRK
jgi:hypothetical protein